MAIKIMRPTSVGSYDGWPLAAGANKTAAMDPGDPVSHDGDTSYLACNVTADVTQAFNMTVVSPVATVNSFTFLLRANSGNIGGGESVSTITGRTKIGGGSESGSLTLGGITGSYSDLSGAAPRPGGGSWVASDIDGQTIQFIGRNHGDGSHDPENFDPNHHYTSLWGSLNYELPAGGFVSFILSLGPVVGGIITVKDMLCIARVLAKRDELFLTRDECDAAVREWNGWKRTKYLWLREEFA